jgi:MFS family permease
MPADRRILLWMCVLVAVNQLGFGAMIPSLPLYAQSFGVGASAIGMAVGIYGLARFFSALPAGWISDGLGRRHALAIGGLISAAGNLWCALAASYPEFIVARFVAGFGAGLIVTTGQVVLADITTPANRGRTISIYQGTFIFAVGIGPFPGGLLAEHYGLAAPFVANSVSSTIAAVLAWLMIGETRLGRSTKASEREPLPPFLVQLGRLTRQRGYMLVSLVVFMNSIVRTGGLFSVVPLLASAQLGISVAAIGFAMMLGSVAGLIAAYPAGWLTDRFGRKAVIVPATVIGGASMLLFAWASSYAGFTIAAIVWGVAISVGASAPAAYAADSAPAGMNATAMSIFRMFADAGYVIGPLALGVVVDYAGAGMALLIAAASMIVAGIAFAVGAPETYTGPAKS